MSNGIKYTYDTTMFAETFEREFTYINGFLRNTHRFAKKNAMTCPIRKKSWTYSQLDLDTNQLANALVQDGVKENDVIMYQLYNCIEFVFLFLAPQKIGAINCPINYRLSAGETAVTIDDSKPTVFVYDAEIKDVVEKALEMAKHKPERVLMVDYGVGSAGLVPGAIPFEDYYKNMPNSAPKTDFTPHIYRESTRLYTSGTTGMPKGVPLNNVNEVLSAHDVIMHFPMNPLDKTLNMTPWFHRGGLYSGGPNPTLYVGGEVIPLRNFSAEAVLKLVQEYGVTFLIGAPATLQMLYDHQIKNPMDISSLKGIITMGAPLDREACIKYHKVLTPNIFNGYGTTESFWNTFLRPYDLPEMAGTAGRACTDDDVRVVKMMVDRKVEPNEVVAKDNLEVGEVIFKVPNKCSYAYINQPHVSKERFYKGWVYSGDLATWDENEMVTIVSRKDDMLITGGENVYPVQVEAILNENPKVRDSIIVGLPDKKWGTVICAYIVKKDPSLTAKELDEYCRNHPMLANFKRPRYYRFVDKLPMNATGKKLHYQASRMVIEDFEEGLLESV